VLVGVAEVADAVAVGVALIGVGNPRAVVAGVADAVLIVVGLVGVGDQPAVVGVVGDAVTVGVVGVRQGLALVGVGNPHRTAAATAAAAALLLRGTAIGAEALRGVVGSSAGLRGIRPGKPNDQGRIDDVSSHEHAPWGESPAQCRTVLLYA